MQVDGCISGMGICKDAHMGGLLFVASRSTCGPHDLAANCCRGAARVGMPEFRNYRSIMLRLVALGEHVAHVRHGMGRCAT